MEKVHFTPPNNPFVWLTPQTKTWLDLLPPTIQYQIFYPLTGFEGCFADVA